MGRFWIILWFVTFSAHFAAAETSLVSFLSQKTNEIRNLEQCPKAHSAEAAALMLKSKCDRDPFFQKQLLSHDEISEQVFFDTAAKRQLTSYECVSTQASELLNTPPSEMVDANRKAIAETFKLKITRLRSIQQELNPIEEELAGMRIKQNQQPIGDIMPDTTVDEARKKKLEKRRTELLTANEIVTQSLWQGGNYRVRKRVQEEIKKKTFSPEAFAKEFLADKGPGNFNTLLNQIRADAVAANSALSQKADGTPVSKAHFTLNDKEKVQLYRDQNWLDSKEFSGLSCRLEGRYGIGRERFYTAAETAATIGLTFIPGGFYLAAARGLIAASTARALTFVVAAGISAPTLATTYENKCMKSATQITAANTCASPSSGSVLSVEEDSCVLDVALAALDVPFPELKQMSLLGLGLRGLKFAPKKGPAKFRNVQLEVWNARAAGRPDEALMVDRGLRHLMTTSEIKVVGMVGDGRSGAFYVRFDNGVEGVWKPSLGAVANGKAEIAVDRIDRLLGWDLVPATMPRTLHGIEGTVQIRVTNLQKMTMGDHPREFEYFDFLIGNRDRHNGNFLITENDRLVAIDHGRAFRVNEVPPNMKELNAAVDFIASVDKAIRTNEGKIKEALARGATLESPEVKELQRRILRDRELKAPDQQKALALAQAMMPPKAVIDRLKSTTKDQWQALLQKNLTDTELNELVERQRILLQSVERAQTYLGPAIFLKP